jgi:hypothetical protein
MQLIDPFIIDQIERDRRRREQPAQVPLYIDVPQEIPPGWEPDPESPGNYRRKEDKKDDGHDRGVVIFEM